MNMPLICIHWNQMGFPPSSASDKVHTLSHDMESISEFMAFNHESCSKFFRTCHSSKAHYLLLELHFDLHQFKICTSYVQF